MDGLIIVDKPEGWTSHDVVGKFRGIARTKRVGHLGTLDPIATGVLPLVVGSATRLAQFYTKADKIYKAVVRFGFATDTYDRSGTPSPLKGEPPTRETIEAALDRFRGKLLQTPPQYSAKKIGGVRAYKAARQKIEMEIEPVEVEIYELRVESYSAPDLHLHVHCSGGTYVRSIAHELGQVLECGAHLQELRRVASGEFLIERAKTLPELEQLAHYGRLGEVLLPAAEMLPAFPTVVVDDFVAGYIRQGRDFPVSPFRPTSESRFLKALARDGKLLAIGEVTQPNFCHPTIVFPEGVP